MDAEIINVGSDLLIGDTVNNTQQLLVTELANIDVNVRCTNSAGLDPQRMRDLLSTALSRSDVILLVGGMGPNREDITKQTVCDALGLAMVPHEVSRNRILEYCNNNGITVNDTIMSMADMPAGSVVFRNDTGMCPGCAIRSSKQCIVMVPSSTVELTPMIRNYVAQYLKQLSNAAVFSQVINIFYLGVTLHDVEERLGHLLNSPNPTVKCTEMTGEIRIRVTAKTNSEQLSREMAAPVIKQILDIFGSDAYGMNTVGIEEVVVKELKERKMTLSTAESCTAGIISKRVTDIPGASRVFEMGAATYSSNKKSDMLGVSDRIIQRYGAVSPEAAAAMAVGARRLAGSTLAVSTTGIAGPGGGTALKPVGLVYIALADKENVWIRKTLIQKPGMDRDYVRQVAASHALNLVRLYCSHLPYLMPGYEPLGEGVRESYFNETTVMSPQAMKALAASVPVASLGVGNTSVAVSNFPGQPAPQRAARYQPAPEQNKKKDPSAEQNMITKYQQNMPLQNMPPQAARPARPAQAAAAPMRPAQPQQKGKPKTEVKQSPVQKVIFWLALLVMLCSGGYLLYNLVISPYITNANFNTFRDAHESSDVGTADDGLWTNALTVREPERNADGTLKAFTSLLQLNSDIVGWITVPNTNIDYPVVQYPDDMNYYDTKGEYFYLHKNIYGEHDKNGTIFAYFGSNINRGNDQSRNIVLFGHHMKSGVMFQNIMKYDVLKSKSNLDFYKENPVIRFDTKYEEGQWVIFAFVKADSKSDEFYWIRSDFDGSSDYQTYIDSVRERSLIDTYSCVDVNTDDFIVTLQTCSYEFDEARTLLYARKLRDNETIIDVSTATIASNPVMPAVLR